MWSSGKDNVSRTPTSHERWLAPPAQGELLPARAYSNTDAGSTPALGVFFFLSFILSFVERACRVGSIVSVIPLWQLIENLSGLLCLFHPSLT